MNATGWRSGEPAPGASVLISQKGALATLGIDPRRYLELLRRRDCPLEVIRRGKLRLVELLPTGTDRFRIGRFLPRSTAEREGGHSPRRRDSASTHYADRAAAKVGP